LSKVFVDTEFHENGTTIDLISIGAVREDGEEFYAISEEFDLKAAWRVQWLRENVLSHLPLRPTRAWPGYLLDWESPIIQSRKLISKEFLAFAGPSPEFYGYYADYDWVAVCQLYGRMIDLPDGWPMYCRDLKQMLDDRGLTKEALGVEEPKNEHNALADAHFNLQLYEALAMKE